LLTRSAEAPHTAAPAGRAEDRARHRGVPGRPCARACFERTDQARPPPGKAARSPKPKHPATGWDVLAPRSSRVDVADLGAQTWPQSSKRPWRATRRRRKSTPGAAGRRRKRPGSGPRNALVEQRPGIVRESHANLAERVSASVCHRLSEAARAHEHRQVGRRGPAVQAEGRSSKQRSWGWFDFGQSSNRRRSGTGGPRRFNLGAPPGAGGLRIAERPVSLADDLCVLEISPGRLPKEEAAWRGQILVKSGICMLGCPTPPSTTIAVDREERLVRATRPSCGGARRRRRRK